MIVQAKTRIRNSEFKNDLIDSAADLLYFHQDMIEIVRKFDCVAYKIDQDLLGSHFVDLNSDIVKVELEFQTDTLGEGLLLKQVDNWLHNVVDDQSRLKFRYESALFQKASVEIPMHLSE